MFITIDREYYDVNLHDLTNFANDGHDDYIFYKKLLKKILLQNLVTFW